MTSEVLRVVVVDDEELARKRMISLLGSAAGLEVVAECRNADEAIETIERLRPDVVFLDVQMDSRSGFDVVRGLRLEPLPAIVFATAYDRYAVEAFEVNAVDYLMKPITRERFTRTVEKIRQQRSPEDRARLSEMMRKLVASSVLAPRRRMLIKLQDQILFLNVDEVQWIEACGNYIKLHHADQSYYHRISMTALERQLDSDRFCRINRSTIINVGSIRSLATGFRGDLVVKLTTGEELKLNRRYRKRLEALTIR